MPDYGSLGVVSSLSDEITDPVAWLQEQDHSEAPLTPQDLEQRRKVQQILDEQNRARALNENPKLGQYLRQVPQRALLAGNPTAASIQYASDETPSWVPANADSSTATSEYVPDWVPHGDSEYVPDWVPKDGSVDGSKTPETDKALIQSREAQRPKVDWNHPVMQGVSDVVKGLAGGLKQLPEMAYQGAKFAAGGPQEKAQVAGEALKQAIPMGQQIASDVKHPIGSREWTRGILQLALMAAPAKEVLKPAEIPLRTTEPYSPPPTPPVQRPGTIAADVSQAIQGPGWEKRFQLVPEPKTQVEPAPDLETVLSQLPRGQFGTETAEGFVPQARTGVVPPSKTARIGGETDASQIRSTTEVPVRDQGEEVGGGPRVRQQGETTGTQAQEPVSPVESVAATPPAADAPTPVEEDLGISQARTEAELGIGSVVPGEGAEMGSGFAFGRNYINKGGDPRLPIRRALASGLVGKNEVGIVHAELDRLRQERNVAAKALEKNPDDPVLQTNLDKADEAQRSWRKELQPVLTKASDALKEAYARSVPEADPSTYEGLANVFDEHFKGQRPITPEMRTAMSKAAKGVKDLRDTANNEMKKVEDTLTKQLKGKKVMTPKELDADLKSVLESEFSDCVI